VLSEGPLRIRAKKNTLRHARLGLVIAKRVFSKAVRRNRVKRIIRNDFRQNLDNLPSLDLVVQLFAEVEDTRLHLLLAHQFLLLERAKEFK
jgi:ribonuclease P protein component